MYSLPVYPGYEPLTDDETESVHMASRQIQPGEPYFERVAELTGIPWTRVRAQGAWERVEQSGPDYVPSALVRSWLGEPAESDC